MPPSKAEQIRGVFVPMADKLQTFEDAYNLVMQRAAEEVTPAVSKDARRLRLDIAKVRIEAEKARKEIKAEYVLAGKAIDGVSNILKWAVTEKETALEKIEKHAEHMEQERLAAVHAARCEALFPYVDEVPSIDFSAMDDDVWSAYLSTKKRDHEDRVAAEAKAEAERVERERVAALVRDRERRVAPLFDFFWQAENECDLGALSDDDFTARLAAAEEAKAAHVAEQDRVRAENERLAAEAAAKEAERQAELARLEAARQAELAAIEAERQKEREAAEAERRRLAELEAAERERAAQAESEALARAAAAKEAAKAPVRKRLTAWVDSFALPDLPGEEHEVAERVRARFAGFQTWARDEIAGGV